MQKGKTEPDKRTRTQRPQGELTQNSETGDEKTRNTKPNTQNYKQVTRHTII